MTHDEQRRRVEDAIWDAQEGEHPPIHELSEEAQKELFDQAEAALAALEHPPVHAYTPREGLLMVLEAITGIRTGGMSHELRDKITEAAMAGLASREDFLTTDRLVERLAEAHGILRDLLDGKLHADSGQALDSRVAQALSLPPDLEPMIERRIGHRPG